MRLGSASGATARSASRGRIPFSLAAIGILLYFANIAAGMLAAKLGWELVRFNDVWEFLVVMISMIFFVAGLLAVEGERPDGPR